MKYFILVIVLYQSFYSLSQPDSVLIFGHRGCRGLMPENSIEGFQKALDLGADGIELDVVVNKDKQLVISHEPYFQSEFCVCQDGEKISSEKKYNIYEMTQDAIREFDCGSKGNRNYPEQEKFRMHKPLLSELLKAVDLSKTEILFEIKSVPKEYGVSQPEPKEYVRIIMKELDSFPFFENITFMAFDKQILEELKLLTDQNNKLENGCELKTVYLTYKPLISARVFLNDLSFKPTALGMFYPTVNRKKARYLHHQGIKLYTWTIKNAYKAEQLKRKGVDGIITDFPDRIH